MVEHQFGSTCVPSINAATSAISVTAGRGQTLQRPWETNLGDYQHNTVTWHHFCSAGHHITATLPPKHDAPPPQGWPDGVAYLQKSRLSPSFPRQALPLLTASGKFAPRPVTHPPHVAIKSVNKPGHPAHGQRCLVAKKRIPPNELILPYLGVLHVSFSDDAGARIDAAGRPVVDPHDSSDYDLSLLRLSSADPRNPFGVHLSIGVDAASEGNAARFVNDFRGIGEAPNAEFRIGKGEGGELRMEVWSSKNGVAKGSEVLVSYGKAWWGARK